VPCPCPMLPAMSARSYWHRGGGKDARKRRRRARAAVSGLFAARQLARVEEGPLRGPLHAEEEGAFSESTCSPPSQETAAAHSCKPRPVARSPNPVWMPPQPPCSVLPPGARVPMVPFTGPVMGQPVAQAPPVTDDLQVALRKALHDQLDILKAVHEKNKANAKVTENLLTHVVSQKEASSSKKQKSSWKAPRGVQLQEAETVVEAPTVLRCLPHAHLLWGRAWLLQHLVPIGEAAGTSAVVVAQQLAVAG